MFERKSFNNRYEGAIEPFKIIGNTYFTGTFPASSHLIDTGTTIVFYSWKFKNNKIVCRFYY